MKFETIRKPRLRSDSEGCGMFEIHRQIIVGFSPISDWYFIPKYVV